MVTIALTIVTIFILSRFIAQPLVKMKHATKQLSKGNHNVVLHTERKDELGELANSITKLSRDLKLARNEFLASISHELRTPLTYIKGYADIMNRPDTSEKEIKEYVDIIQEEAEQLTSLIKNLFQLAKIDQNNFLINRKDIVLCDFLQDIAERIRPILSEQEILLNVTCPNKLVVFIDPERMQQVFVNILENAKKTL